LNEIAINEPPDDCAGEVNGADKILFKKDWQHP
jgi:hypothetical protein